MKHSKSGVHLHRVPAMSPPALNIKESVLVGIASIISSEWLYPLFKNSFLGRCGYIGKLRREGREADALAYLLHLLEAPLSETHIAPKHWWYFMRLTVMILQNQQLLGRSFDYSQMHYLLSLCLMTDNHREGFDAAYALVGFALWSIQEGALVTAHTCTQLAINADSSWGYSYYLHGWTGLLGQGLDPLKDFIEAIQRDWSILHYMKEDPLLSQYPQLIEKIQKSLLVQKSSSDTLH